MTKIEVTGKVIPSGVLDKKFVQGENKMEKIQFALPLNYGGVDMADMNYTLRLANVAGTVTSAALAKTVADKVNLEWTVTEDFVRMPGNCRIELDGVDADGAHKFLAVSAWFDVLRNLGQGSNLPPKDEITAALESMQVYVSDAAASAEDAKRWAEQSAAAAADIEQQLQDAVDVTQALTDKTTEAQGVVDELGDMLAEADLSQYVTKTGTSVVTGDLRVPAPATADSAVNREYADGKLDKTGGTMEGLIVSKYGSNENNPAISIQTNGNPGSWNTSPIEFKNGSNIGDTFWLRFAKASNTDGLIIPSKLKDGLPDVNSRFRYTHGDTPIEGTDLTPKDYSDAVPYQYAKKAGFPGIESTHKRNLVYQPTFFYESTTLFTSPGIVKIASANNAILQTNLIIEGSIRNMTSTNMFKVVINQRASQTSSNPVTFEGFGNIANVPFVNLIVTKTDQNLLEVYVESSSTAQSYAMVVFKTYVEKLGQWTIRENPSLEFTPGTIPGTKIWDLKTAWGSTSRTQITKEEANGKYVSITGGEIGEGLTIRRLGTNANSYPIYFSVANARGVDATTYRIQAVAYGDSTHPYFWISGIDGYDAQKVQFRNISEPIQSTEVATKGYVDKLVATLEAKLTGKTVAEVLAANELAASMPNKAPTLEISSEKEEEITV